MVRSFVTSLIKHIDSYREFVLCQDFDNLSLEKRQSLSLANRPSSSTLRHGIAGMLNIQNSRYIPDWAQPLIKEVRAPFIDLPFEYIDTSSLSEDASFLSKGVKMCFGFRCQPGQSAFILTDLELPVSFEKFSFLSNSLGLFYAPLQSDTIMSFSRYRAGLAGEHVDLQKVLIEVITHTADAGFARFIVRVCLGVGSTVWYGRESTPTVGTSGLFSQVDGEGYEGFLNMDYIPSFYPFKKLTFLETRDISAVVESTFANEQPFVEIPIPAS